ncbi:V-set and immunoglobulin domain-containing protein 4 isoform X2 [Eleutherodactylus coqui]|uniref:V-set and immunoglobulin domain-containing protein 4 isoform X2 n=1 Tax=Eleutherodactylus coqui TaxID=57060 RepID=UPI0034634352
MAHNSVIGHIKWFFVFAICFSGRNVFCDLSLNMDHEVTGYRRQSVIIPCTYTPSKDYTEEKVEWFLEDSDVIILRIGSQDDVPLTKFRERVEISKSPGDVSLTIKKLSIGDKGNIKCKVTWTKRVGTQVSKEQITKLIVLKMKPSTEKPKEDLMTTTHQKHETMQPATEKPKVNTMTTTHQERKTRISHSDEDSHVSTVATMESTKHTTVQKFPESTTVMPLHTTDIFYENPATAQSKGFRMPLFILIAILICVLCITTVVIVLLKKKKKGYMYDLPTMNQLLALEGVGNGQSCTDETRASNVYEQCNPPPVSAYEGIVLPYSNEYEVLLPENPPEENSS